MKKFLKICLIITVSISSVCCAHKNSDSIPQNSIYHWKSTFEIDSVELSFLQKHNVERIYIKMFDVVTEHNFLSDTDEVVPVATTQFVSAVPDGVQVVPVVYITIEALRAMKDKEAEFAELIVERTLAMCRYNKCGAVKQLQLDCDWTGNTKTVYEKLCGIVRQSLREEDIDLSITVRLHQLREPAPPADSGVLMLYNTGQLKRFKTKNSILDIASVEPYLSKIRYQIPLSYAYPVFGWGVRFRDGEFVAIDAEDAKPASNREKIRVERPTAKEIVAVKRLVEKQLGKPANGNILYHLDKEQLKNYTDNEIDQIFAF